MKTSLLFLSLLVLAGCSSAEDEYHDCAIEAARAPTRAGVTVGSRACYEKYKSKLKEDPAVSANRNPFGDPPLNFGGDTVAPPLNLRGATEEPATK
ncbi:MAG: hypothetical protein EOO80_14445 [Oxalobacteraceae bacterium]|nr:MAG: hypothetical protein EOO80_14445 [Oxalobacteraceae bacterium]